MYYVYQYIDPRTNLPFYIGKGTADRKLSHLYETLDTTINKRKYYKIQSILNDGYIPIIEELQWFEVEQDAYNYETLLIKQYGRNGYDENGILMNITIDSNPPSRKGCTLTEEQRQGMKGRKWSEEQHQKMRGKIPWNKGQPGPTPWNKGITGTAGTPCTEENKQKLREIYTGKSRSQEDIQKMKEGWLARKEKGYEPHNKGKRGGTSAKAMKCIFVSPTGEEFEYPSFRQGCLANNLPTSEISKVKNGHYNDYKGWTVKQLTNKGTV